MCAEEKQTRALRPFSLNPTGTLSRRVPAQFVCAVDNRLLKSNTVKRRVHSLFRQGCLYYDAIPNMPGPTLCALIERFQALLMENKVTAAVFAVI